MQITSTPFLFLFLPAVIGIYYLIPAQKGLQLRNLFLCLAGFFFYTWGEPIFVLLLLGMIFLTWCFGKMAYKKNGTRIGKTAVFLTVAANLTVMLFFGKLSVVLSILSHLFGKDFSAFQTTLPIGFSFFVFSSVSYVVDIYRGQSNSADSFLQTVLYTSAFFRILQGPIISYRKFEGQLSDRKESFDAVGNGIRRFSVGLCKKIIIADTLSYIVNAILSSDFSGTNIYAGDAWLGCISYLVYLYFDFSGYSDMAIGLGQVFGFSIPENFNYPYISASVAEFWRRFHITLCVWFTEYVYYPVMLGPSVRFRKFLRQKSVPKPIVKTVQNIFVTASVWLITALWHGMNLNYLLWGVANCTTMLAEPYIKQIGSKRCNTIIRRVGLLFFLFLSVPLISTGSFQDALLFYRAMFTGFAAFSPAVFYYCRMYGLFLLIGVIGCFPVIPYIKKKISLFADGKYKKAWDIGSGILLFLLVLISLGYIFTRNTVEFLYQQ